MKVAFEINGRGILRWILGAVLVWAAVSKLPNLQEFHGALAAYRLPLPDAVVRFTAATLPWLELFCGLLLLARLWYRPALLWFLILCAVFMVSTGQAWARGLNISCGCMNLDFLGSGAGVKSAVKVFESVWFAFIRALALLAGGWYLYCADANRSWPLFRPRER